MAVQGRYVCKGMQDAYAVVSCACAGQSCCACHQNQLVSSHSAVGGGRQLSYPFALMHTTLQTLQTYVQICTCDV